MLKYIISFAIAFIFGCLTTKTFRKWLMNRKVNKEKATKQFKTPRECLAYFGVEIPKGMVIFHKKGNINTFNNLEVITRSEMLKRIGIKKNEHRNTKVRCK